MDAKQREKLNAIVQGAETWPTTGVFIDAYVENESGVEEKTVVDVCRHIGSSSNDPTDRQAHHSRFLGHQRRKPSGLKKMYLSPEYCSNTLEGREAVRNFICSHFDSCGGGIIGSGTSSLSSKEIVFRCYRFRVSKGNTQANRKEAKDSKKAITKTSRPRTSDESCSWRFTLYFEASEDDPSAGRWYLYEDGIGNRFHNGHIQKKEHEISRRVALLDKDELEITDDGLDVNLSSQSMATMFMQRTKLVVDPKKLRNHHTKSQKKHSCSLAGMTAAEQVIHKLSTNDQVSVAWLVADVSIGHKLVTTYTGNRRATSTKVPELNITFQSNIASNGNEPVAS